MGPIWGPSGTDKAQVGPMLAPWTLLSRWVWSKISLGAHYLVFSHSDTTLSFICMELCYLVFFKTMATIRKGFPGRIILMVLRSTRRWWSRWEWLNRFPCPNICNGDFKWRSPEITIDIEWKWALCTLIRLNVAQSNTHTHPTGQGRYQNCYIIPNRHDIILMYVIIQFTCLYFKWWGILKESQATLIE